MIDYTLKSGSHASREKGMCAMEWVAYIAGEEHSDAPKCVCPALRRFGIRLNDDLPDDLRQKLRPYLARCIGTANDGRTQERLFMLGDWAIHVPAVEAMEVRGRKDLADRLRAISPVVDRESARYAAKEARAVRDADYADAAADAADAAAYAAYAAAYAAYAAYAAAYAAYAAADAADAAAAAAKWQMWEKLLPSALELFDRMLPTEAVELPAEMERQYQALCGAVA